MSSEHRPERHLGQEGARAGARGNGALGQSGQREGGDRQPPAEYVMVPRLIVVLICIALTISNVEHLFTCLLAICVSFRSSAHLLFTF